MDGRTVVIGAVFDGLLVLTPTVADLRPPVRYTDIRGAESRQAPVSEAGH